MTLADLITKTIPAGVSIRQHGLRETAEPHGYIAPANALWGWLSGDSRPPATKVIKAAILIGCSEYDVAMACYGVESQAAAIAQRKRQQREKINSRLRERYRTDEEYRSRIASHKLSARPDSTLSYRGLRQRQLRKMSSDERAESVAAWAKAGAASRRARVKGAGDELSGSQLYAIFKDWGYCCAYCGARRSKGVKLTADHVIPLVRGGSNSAANIIPACLTCNSSKQDFDLLEWAERFGRTISNRAIDRYKSLTGASCAQG